MTRIRKDLLYPELSYRICGHCFKVHNDLGRFRNEKQYADALETIFREDGIVFEKEKWLPVSFEGEATNRNKVDFLIGGILILELKAKRFLNRDDYYQMKRYLASSGLRLGILVNFQQKILTPKRILN